MALAIIACAAMLGTLSCKNATADSAETEEMADDMAGEEEQGDADEWYYRVVLEKRKIQPGTEHTIDCPFYVEGLSLLNHNGDYLAYNDEVDYQYYVTPFLFACQLAKEGEFATEKEWRRFEKEVLDKTRYVANYAQCLDEISDTEWREKAKRLWYDQFKNKPICVGESGYGYQKFLYCSPFDYECILPFTVKRVNGNNKYGLPEGAVFMFGSIF